MEQYRGVLINDNLYTGDIGLFIEVICEFNNEKIHHICRFEFCKNLKDAIDFYFEKYHKKGKNPIIVQYHKYSKEQLTQLAIAC